LVAESKSDTTSKIAASKTGSLETKLQGNLTREGKGKGKLHGLKVRGGKRGKKLIITRVVVEQEMAMGTVGRRGGPEAN